MNKRKTKESRKNKNFFLKKQYKKIWEFLKKGKIYIIITIVLFAVSTLVGYLFPIFFRQEIFKFLKKLAEKTADMKMFELIGYLFINNLLASFLSIVIGIAIGIFPIWTAISNGYLLGFVSNNVVAEEGFLILWRLLPHGIFEITAVIISIALGIKLGCVTIIKHNSKVIKQELKEDLRVFLFVILPALLIAAIIEGGLIILFR